MSNTKLPNEAALNLLNIILIPAIIGVAYIFTFTYEIGFVSVFKIPIEFVQINISTIFVVVIPLIVIIPILWLFIRNIIKDDWGWSQILKVCVIAIVSSIVFYAVFRMHGDEQISFILSSIILLLLYSASVFMIKTGKKHSGNKSNKQDDKSPVTQPENKQRVEKILLLLTIFLVSGVLSSFMVGRDRANSQAKFLVYEDSESMVVLRIFGDTIISSPLNRTENISGGRFSVFKVSSEKLDIKLEELGPLTFQQKYMPPLVANEEIGKCKKTH